MLTQCVSMRERTIMECTSVRVFSQFIRICFYFEPFSLFYIKRVKKERLFDLEVLERVIILFKIPQDTPLNGQFLSDLPCAGVMTVTAFAVH